jgi:hypothetical protein
MKPKILYKKYLIKDFLKFGFRKIMRKCHIKWKMPKPKYDASFKWLDIEETQRKIERIILEGKPAMVSRFGSNEAICTAEAIGIEIGARRHFSKKTMRSICSSAGVFPCTEEFLLRYGMISKEAAKKVDLLGVWNTRMQNYLINEVCRKGINLTNLDCLEPYYSNSPWTKALKGKKVLVIHPFKKTIESQYGNRSLLFENPNMLPEFDLSVLKAVQSIAHEKDDRFKDWIEALDYMTAEAIKMDFDVAIIGCGAYGMPLAARIKDYGKVAIHLGGATQLLFGIKGRRWDNQPAGKLYNEHWVRPLKEEMPKNFNVVENGCYW